VCASKFISVFFLTLFFVSKQQAEHHKHEQLREEAREKRKKDICIIGYMSMLLAVL